MLHVRLARPEALYGVLAALHASGRVPAALTFDGSLLIIEVDPAVAARLLRRVDVVGLDVVSIDVASVEACPPPSSPEPPPASAPPSSTPSPLADMTSSSSPAMVLA